MVEQNFDPKHLANNYNKQFPRLTHTQNRNDDPNDQIYDCDDLQDEPHSSMHADFWTNDNSQSDSQSTETDTQRLITKAQIHAPPKLLFSNEQNLYQDSNTKFYDETSSQNRNFSFPENQYLAKQIFRSHDDQEIVMANDEAFGTLDFQHDDIYHIFRC
jgi:hypothetical protein